MRFNLSLFLMALFFQAFSADSEPVLIPYTHEHIYYEGRIGKNSKKKAAEIYWPGSSIALRVDGGSISAILEDQHGENYFNVIVDGLHLGILHLSKGKKEYVLAGGLAEGVHTIELNKRNGWTYGWTRFYGFEVTGSKTIPTESKSLFIEFYGNSITEGHGNEDYTGEDKSTGDVTNNYRTYAAMTARNLGAEYSCIARSGIGILVSWFDMIMPEMYFRLNPGDETSHWDFSGKQADVVVINLLQNDSWLVEMPDHDQFKNRFGETAPTEDQIVGAYVEFLTKIHNRYPDAEIVCMLGNMDITRAGSPWPGYVTRAKELCNDHVHTLYVPFKNSPGHPKVDEHKIMAEALTGFILDMGLTGKKNQNAFPYTVTEETPNRVLSEAMNRVFTAYPAPRPMDNELYSDFKYTRLKGLDYHHGDGTISRRDPSKIIYKNGKYYVWYTYRNTPTPPMGPELCNDTIPSTDWDLCEIWYATSEDGFTWEEQGVAVPRPQKPYAGWRSVSTTDILVWKGKYYLYYQAFLEASGKRGDYCPVAASYADSPDGPWTPSNEIIIENGAQGEWDQFAIHDPCPFIHDDKIYLYYKSAFNRPNLWVGGGLAMADNPLGPFKKHPLNPVLNSGHEVSLFPFKEGIAALTTTDGIEHNTIQYAEDWVNFKIASITQLMPRASGPYIPDAFADNKNGRGITWGLCHFTNAGTRDTRHSILGRFDCDLSLDLNDPQMKHTFVWHPAEVYFNQALSKQQLVRIRKE